MRFKRVGWIFGIVFGVLAIMGVGTYYAIMLAVDGDPFQDMFVENCAVCHGDTMQGGPQGPALIGVPLKHGESIAELTRSISDGFLNSGMPGWSTTMSESHIQSLAILIAERRVDRLFTDFKMASELVVPVEVVQTELVNFRLETVAKGLDPYPFSIAPLPDGRILLSEKTRGLSFVSADGEQSQYIEGTPAVSDLGFKMLGLNYGIGWHLDALPHPNYADNGWIYLHHTHLCEDCGTDGDETMIPVTMNRVVRGRIKEGRWVDEEVIWSVPRQFYSTVPDIGAGGRLAFDSNGHLFLSVGIKGGYFEGVQDLRTPFGKIHRVADDGAIPFDNPYAAQPGAFASTWTYGHRSPQGLEVDSATGKVWGSEMGPRGGDEINLLEPGKNYGWPLYSKGVDYDGTPVEYWKDLNIEFDINDIEQPVVDLTPSPAVSSFNIYDGVAFPRWQGQFIVGSLKATELYRFVIEDNKLVHTEVLIRNLGRIRDVETGPDGLIYLLIEHEAGSQIVRLVPVVNVDQQ
ncbi:MAG: PQQ-dependent sugar dehydrogenase [Proteobacteria bacterium]|nr:PQQ-dependent sugar dehydrogenase [Pseudomonadota bacterium]